VAWSLAAMSLVAALANFVLIPPLGVNGAALAIVIGSVIREALMYTLVYRLFMKKHFIGLYLRPVIGGGGAMVGLALLLWGVDPWLVTVLGLAAYAVVILATGAVRPAELRSILGRS